jgi:hypothetical protein
VRGGENEREGYMIRKERVGDIKKEKNVKRRLRK